MTGRDLPRAVWRKSSHSSGGSQGECVEVAAVGGPVIAARDSKNPDGPILAFTPHEWGSFVASIKNGALHAK
jgi:hypothetical protein